MKDRAELYILFHKKEPRTAIARGGDFSGALPTYEVTRYNEYIKLFIKCKKKCKKSPSSVTGSSTSVELSSSYLTSSRCILGRIYLRAYAIWIIRCYRGEESIRAGYSGFHFSIENTSSQEYSDPGRFGVLISLDMMW